MDESPESAKDIFLCHSSADKGFVRKLASDLSELDIQVWFDEWELEPGDSLHGVIGKALDSSSYVGVVISETSLQSKWCQRELDHALTREIDEGRKLVLPIREGAVRLPPFVRGTLYLDFTESYHHELARLAAVLMGFTGRSISEALLSHPPDSAEEVRECLGKARESSPVEGRVNSHLVQISDAPLNFMGSETGAILLQMPGRRPSPTDISKRFADEFGFPILETREDRTDFIKECLIADETGYVRGAPSPLSIVSSGESVLVARRLMHAMCPVVNSKVSADLIVSALDMGGSRHSAGLFPAGGCWILFSVNAWLGSYPEGASADYSFIKACGEMEEIPSVVGKLQELSLGKPHAYLALDFFRAGCGRAGTAPILVRASHLVLPLGGWNRWF